MKLQLNHQQHTEEEQQLTVTLEQVKGQRLTMKNKVKRRKPKAFKDMTKAGQRVAIAKDVIAQLDAKRIQAMRQIYVGGELFQITNPRKTFADRVRMFFSLPKIEVKPCAVCAVGSAVLCGVRLQGKGEGTYWHETMNEWFPIEQIRTMENYFESASDQVDPDTRLRDVMGNVIRNNGEFIP